jgi:hypothetical protein
MRTFLISIFMLLVLCTPVQADITDIFGPAKETHVTDVTVSSFTFQSAAELGYPLGELYESSLGIWCNPKYDPNSLLVQNAPLIIQYNNGDCYYTQTDSIPINTTNCSGPEKFPNPADLNYYSSIFQKITVFKVLIPSSYSVSGTIPIKVTFEGKVDGGAVPEAWIPLVRMFRVNNQPLRVDPTTFTTQYAIVEGVPGEVLKITIAGPAARGNVPVPMGNEQWEYTVRFGLTGKMGMKYAMDF